ncbi:flagellar hook assembly protein FlgD [uncultured Hydrogenophaga sp.]|uniref:flagellar hook assembly protein FlgD n=1 Tax=uncultured Hydrogenophaga sp. TaxID=199683 RepID=UPI00265E1C22|nr:flagellar hook capping FlgD N-terminal domain-containing protein [uncultured Hydrogenophaga sp.]
MMLTQPLDLTNLGSAVGSSTAKAATAQTDATATQDRFLKLLVAQLNNQDPMNPMDNAQMTTQMTQINTVSGIQQLNETLKGMASQFGLMQSLQGTSLIGREALVAGTQFGFDGNTGKAAFRLDGPAATVQVDVLDKAGQVIDTLDFGALTAGQHSFNWNGAGTDPTQVGGFKVRAANGGQPVNATSYSRLTVTSTGMSNGAMSLQLQDGRNLAYDKVSSFM